MSRSGRTTINGIELPPEFNGASIINRVAISHDGSKYAYVTAEHRLITGDVPEDGVIEIDGQKITVSTVKPGSGVSISSGIHGSTVVMSGSGISVSGGDVHISMGDDLQTEVNQSYADVSRVSVRESSNDITLNESSDDRVHVEGLSRDEPELSGGVLDIDRLKGSISVPAATELDVTVSSGDIDGEVASSGRLQTSSGDISITLKAPLEVIAHTSSGDIDIVGMVSEGRGRFSPPGVEPAGRLEIRTSSGDVNVRYQS